MTFRRIPTNDSVKPAAKAQTGSRWGWFCSLPAALLQHRHTNVHFFQIGFIFGVAGQPDHRDHQLAGPAAPRSRTTSRRGCAVPTSGFPRRCPLLENHVSWQVYRKWLWPSRLGSAPQPAHQSARCFPLPGKESAFSSPSRSNGNATEVPLGKVEPPRGEIQFQCRRAKTVLR